MECEFHGGLGKLVNGKFIPRECENEAEYVTTKEATRFPEEGNFNLCKKHAKLYYPYIKKLGEE